MAGPSSRVFVLWYMLVTVSLLFPGMESDAWQVVSKRKAGKKSQQIKGNSLCKAERSSQELHLGVNVKDVTKKIMDTMENLRISDFWKSCQGCFHKCQNLAPAVSKEDSDNGELMKNQCLEEAVPSHRCLQDYECVCYGLGNFTSCVIARHQLAFLLLFLKQFKIPYQQCYVFDPVFSSLEISVLQELDLKVIFKNEEGKRGVQKPTVFYMLHCGKALYNNLLWKNWSLEALSQIIIIGNSFRGIEERLLSRVLQRDYTYIFKSLQAVEETQFPECPKYSDIFNDTSIHSFPLTKLETFPKDLWQLLEEPQYEECDDLEIIRSLTI